MSKIRLRDHSLGIEVERSINLSNLNWRGNDCLVVDNLQFRGKYLMGREHVQLLFQNITQKWERDWTLVQCISRNMWKLSLLSVWMNGICECVLYCSFISMVSGNVFFIDPLYEWDMWMFSLMFVDWMESMNVFFIVCLYEWNLWMFLYCFLTWMDSVKGFYIMCIWMESVNLFFIVY